MGLVKQQDIICLYFCFLKNLQGENEVHFLTLTSFQKSMVHWKCQTVFQTVPKPLDYFVTKWTKDPYSKMCYSYVPIGVDGDAYDIMSQDVASKVYFAGEVSKRLHAHA